MDVKPKPANLKVENLKVHFNIKLATEKKLWPQRATVKAVDGVDFDLYEGEILGIVGESGCGKSTIAKAIVGLEEITAGKILWLNTDLSKLSYSERKPFRKTIQMIFQNPTGSLNPRMTVGEIIAEPLKTFFPKLNKMQIKEKVKMVMDNVGLLQNMINRYPHEFSGGQNQRIGIARALILEPKLIICDEPVSALDVSIQAQIINLLIKLQQKMGLSLIFISHDLSVVKHLANRVMVLYLGKIAEIANSQELYQNPLHPYTKSLLSSIPVPDPEVKNRIIILEGELPSAISPPSGCVFHTRCPEFFENCKFTAPKLVSINGNTKVACLKY